MGLFSKKVAVNIDAVKNFKESVSDFAQNSNKLGSDTVNELTELSAFAEQRAQEFDEIAKSYEALYSSVKSLERDVASLISSLRSELSNTPKELEQEYTDEEGNVKTKKVPNPKYKELEDKINKQSSRLSKVKDLAYKVNNELSYSRRVAGEVSSSANELKHIIPEVEIKSREVVYKTDSALTSLERCINVISDYISFNFRN